MAEFMIGTLDDKPLKKVAFDDVVYFVDLKGKKVYLDEEGLPRVKDKKIEELVLGASK